LPDQLIALGHLLRKYTPSIDGRLALNSYRALLELEEHAEKAREIIKAHSKAAKGLDALLLDKAKLDGGEEGRESDYE